MTLQAKVCPAYGDMLLIATDQPPFSATSLWPAPCPVWHFLLFPVVTLVVDTVWLFSPSKNFCITFNECIKMSWNQLQFYKKRHLACHRLFILNMKRGGDTLHIAFQMNYLALGEILDNKSHDRFADNKSQCCVS